MTARDLWNPLEGSKKMLIYSANIYSISLLNSAGCTVKSTPMERAAWIAATLPQLDNYPDTVSYTKQGYMDVDAAGAEGAYIPAHNAST